MKQLNTIKDIQNESCIQKKIKKNTEHKTPTRNNKKKY